MFKKSQYSVIQGKGSQRGKSGHGRKVPCGVTEGEILLAAGVRGEGSVQLSRGLNGASHSLFQTKKHKH